MNHFLKYSFSFFCLLACSACDDDGIDILDIEIPEGYALSAGTSTIFLNSSVAYDTPADWITGAYDVRFTRGDRLYDDVRTNNRHKRDQVRRHDRCYLYVHRHIVCHLG